MVPKQCCEALVAKPNHLEVMELLDPRQVKVSVFCVVFSHALRSEDQTFHHVCDGSIGLDRKGFGRGSHLTSGHFRKSWLTPTRQAIVVGGPSGGVMPCECEGVLESYPSRPSKGGVGGSHRPARVPYWWRKSHLRGTRVGTVLSDAVHYINLVRQPFWCADYQPAEGVSRKAGKLSNVTKETVYCPRAGGSPFGVRTTNPLRGRVGKKRSLACLEGYLALGTSPGGERHPELGVFWEVCATVVVALNPGTGSAGSSATNATCYSLFDGIYYSDNRSNSRANTCNKPQLLEGMHLLDKRSTQALPVALMIHDNSSDRTTLVPATHHSNFCPINFRW
ncbi:uncharacterized protein HKW66_Vig0080050 [Vigna angularis]|uniref:Uncharacterized protein n=1 Tax=Phaseolus angularis TaxID=3914 RepID=A0A8T0KMC9_PHAAN|nr:uncharacterized protein HKW66_Vig0080050 [Vigna angularis]